MRSVEEMVYQLISNDMPHIQARLASLESQSKITIALVVGLILAVVAGAISVLIGR
jgi:hypothetical protein